MLSRLRPAALLVRFWLVLAAFLPFASTAQAQEEQQPEHVTVLLDWFLNPDHAPLVVAKQLGFFDDAGLDVELIAPADPNAPPKLVAAKEADIAVSYQPQLHMLVDQGLPLVRIGTLVETPLNSLVTLKDGPVKSIADLKGKKIGFSVSGFEDAILGSMLESHGLKLDDVELININFALTPALLSGQVDAVIGAFRNFELNHLDMENRPGVAFYPEEHGVPAYDELIFIAHQQSLGDAKISAFLRVIERANLYMLNHPKKSWEAFAAYDTSLDTELNRRAWQDTIPRFAKRPGVADKHRYARFAQFLHEKKLISRQVPIDRYVVSLQ